MLYHNVAIAGIGYVLPPEKLSSDQLEHRLAPLYARLRLPTGRLELMSGIAERRLWEPGTLPSEMSIRSGQLALQAAQLAPNRLGALIHASVCRDHLEPATACRVHHFLQLPPECLVYDLSNACLGILNGMLQIANMIELGQIEAGLVVGTESSRPLLEATIEYLNGNEALTRQTIKSAIASLTIGSASCAILLTHKRLRPNNSSLSAAAARAHSAHHELCQSGRDEAVAEGMQPLMDTDSEELMRHGVATGQATFAHLLAQTSWQAATIDKTICHQVGVAHRRLQLQTLGINEQKDYVTYPWLGNTGSAALPVTLARAIEEHHLTGASQVALLGIGSGINSVMLALQWNEVPVCGIDLAQSRPVA
jgi:3-oxoacyl-[acyl-carrier-protein] synthase-3